MFVTKGKQCLLKHRASIKSLFENRQTRGTKNYAERDSKILDISKVPGGRATCLANADVNLNP